MAVMLDAQMPHDIFFFIFFFFLFVTHGDDCLYFFGVCVCVLRGVIFGCEWMAEYARPDAQLCVNLKELTNNVNKIQLCVRARGGVRFADTAKRM